MSKITEEQLRATLPDTETTLQLPGLEHEVEVFRDSYGIPHVRARSEHDAFMGQGLVHAQDRMWQMEYDRRRAYGTTSELLGSSGLVQDRQMRRFQIRRGLEGDYTALSTGARAMLDAFAEGVNAFLEANPLPAVEFELLNARPAPWRALDCLAVLKVRHILMGLWESKIWRARMVNALGPEKTAALHPGYPEGQLLIVPPGQRFEGPLLDGMAELAAGSEQLGFMREGIDAGSNNWVVGGGKTASGLPLLAGDPHRGLDVPNVYYQNHAACEAFDVVGFSFPGVPGFPHFAHNAHVAWCITHGQADYQDMFIEQFDPDDPSRVRFKEQWEPVERWSEMLEVKDGKPEEIELCSTHHGPIIVGDPASGWALAFRYTAMAAPNRTVDAMHAMLSCKNADELEQSQRSWVDPVNNLLYCDVHGAFGYRTRGELPLRSMANAWLPVPGWTGEHEWEGCVPFEEMPALRNPEAGYAYSANNRIVDEHYPHYIALDFAPGFRAERINALLSEGSAMRVEDMGRIHADVVSLPAQAFQALYGQITPADEASARALELLKGWDCRSTRDAAAPLIFAAFRTQLLEQVLHGLLGPLAAEALRDRGRGAGGFVRRVLSRLHMAISQGDSPLRPPGANWPDLMSGALAKAVKQLQEIMPSEMEQWRWDTLHHTGARHLLSGAFPQAASLLDPPPIPMAGDGDTVQAGSFGGAGGFEVDSMSVARYAFDPSDWDRSTWVIPGGASGHPGSPHYADQIGLFTELRMHPMLYGWEVIAREAESTQRLEPAAG